RVRCAVAASERIDTTELRNHLPKEEEREDAEVAPERVRGDVHSAFEEEERGEEGEGDNTHPLLLGAVLDVVPAHDKTKDERREHRLRVRAAAEPHQQEQRRE